MLNRVFPDLVTGYPLVTPEGKGLWSFIEPVASTNLLTNPSAETNTTGHTSISGGVLSRTTVRARYGAYSFIYTPSATTTDGHRTNSVVLTAAQIYTFSVDVWTNGGTEYVLEVTTQAGAQVAIGQSWRGSGRWIRPSLTFTPSTTGNHYLRVRKVNSVSTNPIYTDGWQLEALGYATTYIDGDQSGYGYDYVDPVNRNKPQPYQWLGTPHASQSKRLATTRSGGRIVSFDELGISILDMSGIGATSMNVHDLKFGFVGGGMFLRATRGIRNLTLVCAISAPMIPLDAAMTRLQRAFDPTQGPSTLVYQKTEASEKFAVPVAYTGGLEGGRQSLIGNKFSISYNGYDRPRALFESTATLNYSQNVANANFIVQRPHGQGWRTFGVGMPEEVRAMVYGPLDNFLYIGGNTQGLYRWDGSNLTALAVLPVLTDIQSMAADASGNLYIACTNGAVYRYSISGNTFTDLASGMSRSNTILYAPDGTLYVGGRNTTQGSIRKYSGGVWTTLITTNTAADTTINTLALVDNTLYMAGKFTGLTGPSSTTAVASNISNFNQTTNLFGGMGIGANATVNTIAYANGTILAGGAFTDIGGVASRIGQWNGYQWSAIGQAITYEVKTIAVDRNGLIYHGGVGPASGPDSVGIYRRSRWEPIDIDLPGTATVNNIAIDPYDTSITLGFNTNGTAKSAVTAVNNTYSEAYPRITFKGSGTIGPLINYTTGKAIYFDNLSLADTETATLDLTPGNISFRSPLRGDLMMYIAPGSNMDWYLVNGVNNVSSYIYGTTSANTGITMTWKPTISSLEEAL